MNGEIRLFIEAGKLAEVETHKSNKEVLKAIGRYLEEGVTSVEVYIKGAKAKQEEADHVNEGNQESLYNQSVTSLGRP